MRLTALVSILVCTLATTLARGATPASNVNLPRPTPEQAAWQDLELGMFYHFDIATFSDGGEGDWPRQGHLDPSLYNPTKLNTDQWLEAAKAMGAGYTVFVAKHCTGFIAWQSDAYPYGVRQSKWRDGKGDVVADYVASCRKCGIRPGIYCSMPANAYCEVFDNCTVKGISGPSDPRQIEYRRRAERLVTELWGNYGPLTYIWFDGGTLPPDQGGPDLVPILKRLQPHAVTFQGPPDNPAGNTRWPGNEDGVTGNPSWSTVARTNDSGAGNPQGKIWQPGECDAPLRNHDWFWHPNRESKIRTVDELVEMYYGSVGHGCNLILNGNIDRDGLVPKADLKRFKEFGDEIRRRFGKSIAETSGRGNTVELTLAKPTVIDNVILMEQITEGERVRRYVLEGQVGDRWTELAHGRSIGHKRIERFAPVEVTKIRFRATETVAEPVIRKLAVYRVQRLLAPAAVQQVDVFQGGAEGYHTYRIPAIVLSNKNTLLAFCEGRKTSADDAGDIDLMLRRSSDGGKTWRPVQTVYEEGGTAKITIGNPCPIVERTTGTIWLPFCRNNDRVFITKSTDDGLTWDKPVEITQHVKKPEWRWYATGPGHGIQLQSGRLVIPCDCDDNRDRKQQSLVFYSDDRGQTWKLGGVTEAAMDECEVVELTDRSLLLCMRNYRGKNRRAFAASSDAGLTWSEPTYHEQVYCPTCQASIQRYSPPPGGKNRILYSGPGGPGRNRMTIRLSYDEGNTWPVAKVLYAGSAAYSDLVVLPDGSIGCLYERDDYRKITFTRFTLGWLTEGKDQP